MFATRVSNLLRPASESEAAGTPGARGSERQGSLAVPLPERETITIMKARNFEAWGDYLGLEMHKRHGLPKEAARQIAARGLRSIMKSMHPAAGRVTMKRARVKAT